ncbi:putative DNA primase subunit [Vibrio phage vB_VmeM-32]|nr:putative DNA primase subunit [Vibrio phage vB_VmeM-32]
MIGLNQKEQIARQIAYGLPNYSDQSVGNRLRLNFSCHVCGDSKTDRYMARGWLREYKGDIWYTCFNCGHKRTIDVYLKEHHEDTFYKDFIKLKYSNSDETNTQSTLIKTKPETKATIPVIEKLPYSVCCDSLEDGHPVTKYLNGRLIPKSKRGLFYYTSQWKKLANYVKPETYKYDDENEHRLVIPIFEPNGDIACIQGRALSKNVHKSQRYLTIKPHEDSLKLYGLERVKDKGPVFYLEGPIDSIFILNGIGIVGGMTDIKLAPYENRRVWVLDNEPFNPQTVSKIKKLIDANEKIVLFDNLHGYNHLKDVNDMIINGCSVVELNKYLLNNIISGLSAKMRFNSWKRC